MAIIAFSSGRSSRGRCISSTVLTFFSCCSMKAPKWSFKKTSSPVLIALTIPDWATLLHVRWLVANVITDWLWHTQGRKSAFCSACFSSVKRHSIGKGSSDSRHFCCFPAMRESPAWSLVPVKKVSNYCCEDWINILSQPCTDAKVPATRHLIVHAGQVYSVPERQIRRYHSQLLFFSFTISFGALSLFFNFF